MVSIDKPKGFCVSHINIQSLYPEFEEVKLLIKRNNIDVLAITESWLHDFYTDQMVHIDGYSLFRLDRQYDKEHGGIVVYVKSNIFVNAIELDNLNRSNSDIEALWLVCKPNGHKTFTLGVFYRQPKGNHQRFLDYLEDVTMTIARLDNWDHYLVGDFNAYFHDDEQAIVKSIKSIVEVAGLKQMIYQMTRVTKNSETLIDQIFTNCEHIVAADVFDPNISDHHLIYTVKKIKNAKLPKKEITTRTYKNLNIELLCSQLRELDWSAFHLSQSVEHKWEYLANSIINKLNEMCPLVTFTIKDSDEPWINNNIIQAIREKHRAYEKAKKSKLDADWEAFKKCRNEAKTLMLNAKEAYIKFELEKHRTDPKKFWQSINKLLSNNKRASKIQILGNDGQLVGEDRLPNLLNNHFIQMGQLPAEYMLPFEYHGPILPQNFNFTPCTSDFICKIIKDIDIGKSTALDHLPAKVLKPVLLSLSDKLLEIINLSLATGEIPDDWKKANVVPLEKITNTRDISKLRPVSLLALPSKILERVVYTQVQDYLSENEILTDKQNGFSKGKSTITTTLKLLDDIYAGINVSNATMVAYIDFSRAFDCIRHDLLIKKLEYLGMTPEVLKWFHSYLYGRSQRVKVNGSLSPYEVILTGVPQGSLLGPLLFLIFVNDLPLSLKHTDSILYADDTVIYTKGKTAIEMAEKIKSDLVNLDTWCKQNNMLMNPTKTKLMLFGTHQVIKK